MKMYKCIVTEMLAGKKKTKTLKIHYPMLEAIVKKNQGQVNRAMWFQEITLFYLGYPRNHTQILWHTMQVIRRNYNLPTIQRRKWPRWQQ